LWGVVETYISEFSYGYALTSELITAFALRRVGAPTFATQRAEGKKGGGWDVKLPGIPVYLQMKRSMRMVRSTAQEYSTFNTLPFFRMYLHRRDLSDQHQLLLDLESTGNIVVYAAPGFSTADELNDAYTQDLVATRSVFVRPSAVGPLADDKQHWVAFRTSPQSAVICSRPRSINGISPSHLFRPETVAGVAQRRDTHFPNSYGSVVEELIAIYERRRSILEDRDVVANMRKLRDRRESPELARVVAMTLFQCEVLFVPLN
jgi:hypothetical protein